MDKQGNKPPPWFGAAIWAGMAGFTLLAILAVVLFSSDGR